MASSKSSRGILLLDRRSMEAGKRFLAHSDPALGEWVSRIGPIGLRRQRHRFGTLCRSILSQQLASAAARTIHRRFREALGGAADPSPRAVLGASDRRLRACGISAPKLRYLKALAREFDQGALRRARLAALPDPEVVELLCRVPGIGVWTAEMFLIFHLGRRDVFSPGDLALRNGVARLTGREVTPRQAADHARRWAPYRSVASLYLWRIAHWQRGQ